MKIVVAIDSLKGCLSSEAANHAAREGLCRRFPGAEIVCLPVSDGGEGFLEAMEAAVGGELIEIPVRNPRMHLARARYLLRGRTAYVEMAQASGLCLLKPEERNPLTASSYGTGQLIADAARRGAGEIYVGLGGSATSDCGRGMLQALSDELGEAGAARLRHEVDFSIATDVDNPLCGERGAARVFGPQKMSPRDVESTLEVIDELERRARAFALANAQRHGRDCSRLPGAGAAGGTGYALMQFFGAKRLSGAELMLEKACLDTHLQEADLAVTGEGRADRQTLMGKLPVAVLHHARNFQVPVWLVAGQVIDRQRLEEAGFARVLQITPEGMPLAEAVRPDVAAQNLMDILR